MASGSVLRCLHEVGDTVPNPTDILGTLLVKSTAAQEGDEVFKTPFLCWTSIHPSSRQVPRAS